MVRKNMKLRKIYESILTEIGDSAQSPPNAKYSNSKISFVFNNLHYNVDMMVLVNTDGKQAFDVDFNTDEGNFGMTNQHDALKLMSMVTGAIEHWLFNTRVKKTGPFQLIYLRFNPKSEDEETISKDFINRRDRLYRAYIDKFAKRYNSSVTFSTVGGVIAQFKPPIEIK